jgi:hypothetical protein
MIVASTYLPSATSSKIAASSIHGTGDENLLNPERNGCTAVSGVAFGPSFLSRIAASSFVRPLDEASVRLPAPLSDELIPSSDGAAGLDSSDEGRFEDKSDID